MVSVVIPRHTTDVEGAHKGGTIDTCKWCLLQRVDKYIFEAIFTIHEAVMASLYDDN